MHGPLTTAQAHESGIRLALFLKGPQSKPHINNMVGYSFRRQPERNLPKLFIMEALLEAQAQGKVALSPCKEVTERGLCAQDPKECNRPLRAAGE